MSFCSVQGLMVQQTISAPRWWELTPLLVLSACFKIGTQTHVNRLSKPLLPWRSSVRRYVILYCARTHDWVDDFRSKMVEMDVLSRLFGLLQDQGSNVQRMHLTDRVGHLVWSTVNGIGNLVRPTVSGMGGHLLQSTVDAITTLVAFGGLLFHY